ncbi:WD40-repeat-containing domain protein [Protomyces lactucae-debilis]|uniref:WD40-repeat-containing domain protein n=1 Tax=Protomyces lactucae-debilis TaxID=2754530 RepID=A0A1Y2EV44_PROLT|nr:WD40-repeat-containing domain protein [Protomyces lactucae-debilis]ORY75443.1 WD40-repeat-containing domain protein [Protomyces lactucae-debilis]
MATTTQTTVTVETAHGDMIHDCVLDYYGKRLATCSSDKTIKIFEIIPPTTAGGQAQHQLLQTLRGHEGPVWQVAWAHPKFGTLLASAGYDGKIFIWREQSGQWSKLAEHHLHAASVNSVAWSPHEQGAVLACASSDGKVSLLEFKEDGSWDTRTLAAHAIGCNAASWAPAQTAGSLVSTIKPAGAEETRRFVSGGCDNLAKIWKFDAASATYVVETTLEGHTDWVRDVAWAPSIGLPKNIIATAGQDRMVYLFTQAQGQTNWQRQPLQEEPFADVVWRVSWSESGGLLAVSCGNGKIYVYKETVSGWEEVKQIAS